MTLIETSEISSRQESFPLKMSIDDNYYEYLINKSYCDFTLKCSDGIDIPIHRLILSKKSEVFKKIFELNLIERKNKGFAYCDNIESSTLMDVLRFVYTGSTEEIEMTPRILYAAENYKLDNLKHHCVEKLLKNINVDNAVDVFKAAGKCNVEVLEEKALSFILK
jgi:BTB/POZ domain